jgi:aryl-alcohol dehydrogenase-like predicted oxidoreductase
MGRTVQQMTDQPIQIGATDLRVPPLGVGTWQWGDKGYWGFGTLYARPDVEAAYQVSREAGLTFFDTAEVYGRGTSETILGALVRNDPAGVVVATKYAGAPVNWTARRMARAVEGSLARLGTARVDLYQIHWPYSLSGIPTLMNAMADLVEAGKVRAVGVSNFSARQMYQAHAALARRGIPLASNQVHYSLLHRQPERNGVLMGCRELGVRLIAYSPLEQGLLTGKYHDGKTQVTGIRRWRGMHPAAIRASLPVIELLRQIGAAHGGKTPGQVALRWLMRREVLPIPGAKNATQARANAGALGWELTDEEYARLNALRDKE